MKHILLSISVFMVLLFYIFNATGDQAAQHTSLINLEFSPGGQNPNNIPNNAVAWVTNNYELLHTMGPYAISDEDNPYNLKVIDPKSLITNTPGDNPKWIYNSTNECGGPFLKGRFDGVFDPDVKGCSHGILSWGFINSAIPND